MVYKCTIFGCLECIAGTSSELEAVAKINRVRNMDRSELNAEDIQIIRKVIDEFECNEIHLIACQTLGELCLRGHARRLCIQEKAYLDILKILQNNYKTRCLFAWMCTACLWNITLSPATRGHFPLDTIDTLIKILSYHSDTRIVNSCFGLLLNLSLEDSFRIKISTLQNLCVIQYTIERQIEHTEIGVTALGIVANVTIDQNVSALLVHIGIIGTIKRILLNSQDFFLCENAIISLENLRLAPKFLQEFCKNNFMEILYDIIIDDQQIFIPNHFIQFQHSIDAIEHTLGIDIDRRPTSFHICAIHGLTETLQKMLSIKIFESESIDRFDLDGYGLLDYAIRGKNLSTIQYLASLGLKYSLTNSDDVITLEILDAIELGMNEIESILNNFGFIISESIELFIPQNMIQIIFSFLPTCSLKHLQQKYLFQHLQYVTDLKNELTSYKI
jgi:hypothetical protein